MRMGSWVAWRFGSIEGRVEGAEGRSSSWVVKRAVTVFDPGGEFAEA